MAQTVEQKQVVQDWIAALESGEYKQGTGKLCVVHKKFDSFCCLGVLCDMAVRAGVIEAPDEAELGSYLLYEGQHGWLTKSVQDWVGLVNDSGFYARGSLINENDGGATFPEIAAIIRSNPDGLFV